MSPDPSTKCPFCDVSEDERKLNLTKWNIIEAMTDRIATLQNKVVDLTTSLGKSIANTDAALLSCQIAVDIGNKAVDERDVLRVQVKLLEAKIAATAGGQR